MCERTHAREERQNSGRAEKIEPKTASRKRRAENVVMTSFPLDLFSSIFSARSFRLDPFGSPFSARSLELCRLDLY
jgi:hypothetical protein